MGSTDAGARWPRRFLSAVVGRGVGLTPLGRAYARAASGDPARLFCSRALDELDVHGRLADGDLRLVPSEGPLLVIANHPLGALDGLLLLDLLTPVRPDMKLIANRMLGLLPALGDRFVLVDVFGGPAARRANGAALRHATEWLADGGCLGMFPAGEVAHRLVAGRASDSPWHEGVARLAKRARAQVLPVYFEGHNSRLFRAAGRVHPRLRTALLPYEMWARRGGTVSIRVGAPIASEAVRESGDAGRCTAMLRSKVERLADSPAGTAARGVLNRGDAQRPRLVQAVDSKGSPEAIAADIAALPEASLLLESGAYQVFCARAAQLPAVLPEIGRLREVTFRLVGEGTGLARDLDRFDQTYHHLFVWDRAACEIAGAYRMGATDQADVEGLYTRTLFDYDETLIEQMGPALELGRSFVAPRYQRDFSPLMLLWKGISRFVVRAPRYRRLYGVVSISDRYDSTSRCLLQHFLQTTRFHADLGPLVRPKNPPAPPRDHGAVWSSIDSLEDVSARVRALEPDGKDIPVLLKQYVKLNAKLLGFTIDQAFGNVLDGLVVVDLADVEPAILARYMGRAEAQAFLKSMRPQAA